MNTPLKKLTVYFFFSLAFLFAVLPSAADEGMWLPFYLRQKIYGDMAAKGLELSPEEIYSVNKSSLKDAIVSFGGFCTGEVISEQGLVLTNHHCGYDAIRSQSTPEQDYLTDGFWAMDKSKELPIEGLTVSFLVEIKDVSKEMLQEIDHTTTEDARNTLIQERSNKLIAEAEESGLNAEVKAFYEGNEYYLFTYKTYTDIRMVGAPPSSIGKFGGDTDNWMWPRHTGDFSMFRIYAGEDNEPAAYSPNNVPLKPKHHLPVSLGGVKENDFAMIMGYPGNTDRYLSSWGVDLNINVTSPARVKLRRARLDLFDEEMAKSDKVRLQYASKYASISNYWKYFMGQVKGLNNLNVLAKKQALEEDFQAWAEKDPKRSEKYGQALNMLEEGYAEASKYALARTYFGECMLAPEILAFGRQMSALKPVLEKFAKEDAKMKAVSQSMMAAGEEFYQNYDQALDQKIFAAMMRRYHEDLPKDQQAAYFKEQAKKHKYDFENWAEKLYKKSLLASHDDFKDFWAKPSAKKLEKDPAIQLAKAFNDYYKDNIAVPYKEAQNSMDKGKRLFIAGLREMNKEKSYYSDANFTMRLTYGQVLSYEPRDAVFYNYYTTHEGIMQKKDNSDPEFVVPQKLDELIENQDFGRYGQEGELRIGFLTNHDITGGNSGSPVIDGKGRLIGLAFDGNWEAMSGDIAFEPELQRTISVDIRYVLWVIDKYAGAGHLVKEMTLVK